MGSIEHGAKKLRRRKYLQNAASVTVALAGTLLVAAVAPNIMRLLRYTGAMNRLRYKTKSALTRLIQKGDLEIIERYGKKYVRLTERGRRTLELEQEKTRLASGKKGWDGRYRLVMFDVPEKRKVIRERLRFEMREVGFLRVQDSAWVYPYDCEEFIALLKADLHIGKEVLYAVIEQIEYDRWIREHFKLPKD